LHKRSFVIYSLCHHIKANEMDGTCDIHERDEKSTEKLKGRHMADLGIGWSIMLS
jgi:hypothetical protein